jgi:hypothetical protein
MKARAMGLFGVFGFRVYAGTKLLLAVARAMCTPSVQHLSLDTQHQQDGYDGPGKKKNENFDGCFSLCHYGLAHCSKLLYRVQ